MGRPRAERLAEIHAVEDGDGHEVKERLAVWGDREHFVPVELHARGVDPLRGVLRYVFSRVMTSHRLQEIANGLADRTVVHHPGPALGDLAERARERGVANHVARPRSAAAGREGVAGSVVEPLEAAA